MREQMMERETNTSLSLNALSSKVSLTHKRALEKEARKNFLSRFRFRVIFRQNKGKEVLFLLSFSVVS